LVLGQFGQHYHQCEEVDEFEQNKGSLR
jgi:hypothetical protein